ncbi:peptidyl-prolyl cis-trans isomerase C [uncultured Gammaproteobacteria bacterium]
MVFRISRLALMVAVLAGLATGTSAETKPPVVPAGADPVVARVNGEEIHRSDVTRAVSALPAQVRQMPVEMLHPAMVEQLINARLILVAAGREKLADDADVKERLKRAEERIVQEVFLTRAVQKQVTPEVLQQRYQQHLKENPAQEEVRASHILVATEAEAKALIEQLKKGADFSKLARDKSNDKAAAAQGGDLGYFTRDAMVQPFAEAAFAMAVGKVSDTPVKTQFGWHVIKVEDHRQAKPPSFDEIKAELEGEFSQEVIAGVIEKLRGEAKIEQFPGELPGGGLDTAPAKP